MLKQELDELHEAVETWQGPPWHPVIVAARQLLQVARARYLMQQVQEAVDVETK